MSMVAESEAATVYSSVLLDDLSHLLVRSLSFPSSPSLVFLPHASCLNSPHAALPAPCVLEVQMLLGLYLRCFQFLFSLSTEIAGNLLLFPVDQLLSGDPGLLLGSRGLRLLVQS